MAGSLPGDWTLPIVSERLAAAVPPATRCLPGATTVRLSDLAGYELVCLPRVPASAPRSTSERRGGCPACRDP